MHSNSSGEGGRIIQGALQLNTVDNPSVESRGDTTTVIMASKLDALDKLARLNGWCASDRIASELNAKLDANGRKRQ